MSTSRARRFGLALLLLSGFAAAPLTAAQPEARVPLRIDDTRRARLAEQLPAALAESTDLGEVDPAQASGPLLLVLQETPAQSADLARLLEAQQQPGNPEFHRWLTPQQFGARFGVHDQDIARLTGWLRSHRLDVAAVPPGKRLLVFSGRLADVGAAFGTRFHRYGWRGERHLSASSVPTVPLALASVVRGFASLHDFHSRPALAGAASLPDYTAGSVHYLAPADLATIYNATPLLAANAPVNGSGRTIAVLGRTSVVASDLATFRANFGLPANPVVVINNGAAPPLVAGDLLESELDLEWAGALAPAATIKFVTSASTAATDGIATSATYAVNSLNPLPDVISLSYGSCENPLDVFGGTTFYHSLWQQAAAQGISVLVSSGDSGAAGCDLQTHSPATGGAGVNALCSSPYATCVGGTTLNGDIAAPANYWNPANAAGSQASARSYIPEVVWNDSGPTVLSATGGGTSRYFAKPSWQFALGVPADGRRDVPDLALAASGSHDGYLVQSSDTTGAVSTLLVVGGTSASTPAMAGIAALIAQKSGARVGNLNPSLYALSDAQQAGGAAVFHRITAGNNSVPGQAGFSASAGNPSYNLATGLGSVDANQLVTHWVDVRALVGGGARASLAPTAVVLPAAQVVGSVVLRLPAVTTGWTAVSSQPGWLSVTPTSGTGSSVLSYSAAANGGVSRSGTLTIAGLALSVVQASGQVGGAAVATLAPAALTFASTPVGAASAAQRVVLSNTGSNPLTLAGLALAGSAPGDFSSSGSCVAGLILANGSSCYLDVVFRPTASGARGASLQFSPSGLASLSVTLSGSAMVASGGDIPMLPVPAQIVLALLLVAAARQGKRRPTP